jgi:hypothetical protein
LEAISRARQNQDNDSLAAFLSDLTRWYDQVQVHAHKANVFRVELSNASAARRRSSLVPQDLLSRDSYELASAGSMIFSAKWIQQWEALAPTNVEFRAYPGMTSAGAAIFHRLRQLSHIRSKVKYVRDFDAKVLYCFTKNVSILERHINTIVNWPAPDCHPQPALCMPVYSATLAFVYAVFRDLPVSSPILSPFATRLRNALDAVGLERFGQAIAHEFLLWILFLGSWISLGRDEHCWFKSALKTLTSRFHITSWLQAKLFLSELCLVESVCEIPYQRIWTCISEERV